MAHWVGAVDWSFPGAPVGGGGHAPGYATKALVDRARAAVHTDLSVNRLAAGGWIDGHVHAFESAIYILAGAPILAIEQRRHRLRPGDFALLPYGARHSWANLDSDEARWLTVSTPQAIPREERRADTIFLVGDDDARWGDPAERDAQDPTGRLFGHYAGTPPQAQALAVTDPARGRRPAGMDTAILAYSGISVKMLVDRAFGADLLTMFTVDYEPGGAAQIHDHPFEETYFFLDGEIDAILEGQEYRVRAGEVVFAGVGATHGFFNTGPGRVRWVETQAPQPPARHAYRWVDSWKRLEAG
jgi:quercetin dioxygenase-like cupin family protein